MFNKTRDNHFSRLNKRRKSRREGHLELHVPQPVIVPDDNKCHITSCFVVRGSLAEPETKMITDYIEKTRNSSIASKIRARHEKEKVQEVLVATERDSSGLLVWEKSSIIVTKSEPQKRAFEAARKVFAAKMEAIHASL